MGSNPTFGTILMAKPRLLDKNFKWTPQLAYAVGLLVTDGNLSKDGRHVTMRSAETQLLETFKKCLALNNKIGQANKNGIISYKVQFGNVQFYRWLLKIGLFPAKSYTNRSNLPCLERKKIVAQSAIDIIKKQKRREYTFI
ncbi:MAG: hypothetical protein AAB602_00710 [Patescibacteria group bacterium]